MHQKVFIIAILIYCNIIVITLFFGMPPPSKYKINGNFIRSFLLNTLTIKSYEHFMPDMYLTDTEVQ